MGILSWFAKNCPFGCVCCFVPLAPEDETIPSTLKIPIAESKILTAPSSKKSEGGEKSVRLVLISDTHGRHRDLNLPDGDILIHAGDIVSFQTGTIKDLEEFDLWLGEQKSKFKEIYLICGNHERVLDIGGTSAPAMTMKNAKWLHGEVVEACGGLRLFGSSYRMGRGCFYRAEGFGRSEHFVREYWKKIDDAKPIDVVVTHIPPFGILDSERVGHIGDWILLRHILKAAPSLHVFGHVHGHHGAARWKNETKTKEVLFVNAASLNRSPNLNVPIVVDVHPKEYKNSAVRVSGVLNQNVESKGTDRIAKADESVV
mmetsp:Transcript_27178/g.66099  ORF Transcript_27178/g.66099 Transcript_27178/m.66099 type:complete len:315 (+) Transcript_27178:128-1072(+)